MDGAFSTFYMFRKLKIKMSEHAEVGGARKPGEGPQNPEKARKTRRRPAKCGEGPEQNPSLFVWRCATCKSASMAAGDACAAAAGDATDAGDASELVMPRSILPEPRLTTRRANP